jgi:hypothetical protein
MCPILASRQTPVQTPRPQKLTGIMSAALCGAELAPRWICNTALRNPDNCINWRHVKHAVRNRPFSGNPDGRLLSQFAARRSCFVSEMTGLIPHHFGISHLMQPTDLHARVKQTPFWRRVRPFAMALLAGMAGCEKAKPPPPLPPEVEVVTVAAEDVPVYQEWLGSLDGFVNAQIRAQVSGYLMSQNYKEGGVVKKGEVLFQIDPRLFDAALNQAKAQLGMAEAQLGKTELDVKRFTPLAKENAMSQGNISASPHGDAGLLLSPVIAGVAMSFSSVSVIANALRLRRLNL